MTFSFDFTFAASTIIFKVLTQFLIIISAGIGLPVHLRAHVLYKEVNVCVFVYECECLLAYFMGIDSNSDVVKNHVT
jgi:hypothetical protein